MGRPKSGERVRGPYRHRGRFRVEMVGPVGDREVVTFADERTAKAFIERTRARIPGSMPIGRVFDKYEQWLRLKGNKPTGIATTLYRLRAWHNEDKPVLDVTARELADTYAKRSAEVRTDTHRNELAQVKTFWRWAVEQGFVRKSPAESIEPTGRRSKGKPQLRYQEAAVLFQLAIERARHGKDDGLAVAMLLTMGLRSSELLTRTVRDVDRAGEDVILWVEDAKTQAGNRTLVIPEPMASLVLARVANKPANHRWLGHVPSWLRKATARMCAEAGVPVVCPHGLRGTSASQRIALGTSEKELAQALGHSSASTTREHYAVREAYDAAKIKSNMRLIAGGAK